MESRILQLIAALRASGVRVSLAETTEAFSAVDLMGIQDRESFRLSLRATLIKDVRDIPVFDKLFPLFFGSAEAPNSPMGGDATKDLTPEEANMLADALREMAANLRKQLERLMSGQPLTKEELERLAKMVGLNNTDDMRYQNWMAQRMMRAMSFPQVRDAMQELMEELAKMGMSREHVEKIRQQVQANMQGMQEQIQQFAGQRLAENLSQRPPTEGVDGLLDRPFQSLSDAEKKLVQREVRRLAAALKTRIALRQRHAKTGQLDAKATIRANQKYQGVPMEIRHRNRVRKPRIVVICDVSTSMRFCSELMLSFLHALQGQVQKTFAFAFIDHLESISEDFNSSDVDQAISGVLARMPGGYYSTDLGFSLNGFNEDFMHTLNQQTTLLVVGDGRNNYNDPRLDLFGGMARRAYRTIWLNPEPPALWQGDSDMTKYAPLCTNVLKVSNLKELASAVDQLLSS
jgi:uncharacterized protein with von Willebrand factor type A (vWA) domain